MALTIRRKKRLLQLTAAALAGVAVWLGRLTMELSLPADAQTDLQAEPPQTASTAALARRPLDSSLPLWKKPLRRPLYDPPPPPPPKVVKKELPPIRAKLMGTIIEPGASKAMISLPGGRVVFRSAGDALGPQDEGAVITRIGAESIEVARGEESTELKIERAF